MAIRACRCIMITILQVRYLNSEGEYDMEGLMVDKHIQGSEPIPSHIRNTFKVNTFDKVFIQISIGVK